MRRILKLPIFIQLEYKKHQDSLQDKSSYRNPSMVYKPPERHTNVQRDRGEAPGLTRSVSHNNNPTGGNKPYFRSSSDQSNDKSKPDFNSDNRQGWGGGSGSTGGIGGSGSGSVDTRVKSGGGGGIGENKDIGRSNEWKSNPSYNKSWGQTNDQPRERTGGWSSRPNNDQQKPVVEVKKPIDDEDKWSRGRKSGPAPVEVVDGTDQN